jgi:hypothetical protein
VSSSATITLGFGVGVTVSESVFVVETVVTNAGSNCRTLFDVVVTVVGFTEDGFGG